MARPQRVAFRAFARDKRAGVAVMGATIMPLVIACAALAVDLGSIFADRRRVQSAADIAAMVAATNISVANNAAAAAAIQNNFPSTAVSNVELGVYTPNAAISPQSRFVAGGGAVNAVRVTMTSTTPLTFARFFTGSDHYDLHATATATRSAMASFAIGSRTAALNAGLLNAMFGKMLGTNLSLSLSDYNSLLGTRVDLFTFWSALAARLNVTGVTYDSLLSGSAKVGDLVVALQKANTSGNLTSVVNALVASAGSLTASTPLSSIASVGPYSSLIVGQKPQTSVDVSMLDMLSAIAMASNGISQIDVPVSLSLPGIASASASIIVGAQPQGASWTTVGLPGATASTAQTRVALSIQLLGTSGVPLVNLPLYVEVARGTATLNTLSCGYPDVALSSLGLGVTPGLVDAWIGTPAPYQFSNLNQAVTPVAVTLANIGAVTVTGFAHATIGNMTPSNVSFSYSDIQSQTKKTATTTNFTSSLTTSLLGNLSVNVTTGPFGVTIPGLAGTVTGIISGATSSIDQLLASVLATLGVGVGQADVWVNGIRCDGAVLVN